MSNYRINEADFNSYIVDPVFYEKKYKDVAYLGVDPLWHYVKYGKVLGRHRYGVEGDDKQDGVPIYASLASMPSRVSKLEIVVDKILPQVDKIFVYLNNYEEIPAFLTGSEKIVVNRSQDHGDLKDNGKFFPLDEIGENAYFFTIDDDILYPDNYIEYLRRKINQYDKKVVVGVHGAVYGKYAKRFFERKTIHFSRELLFDTPVSVLGTGTVGFYTGAIDLSLSSFLSSGKADLYFGAKIKQDNIPALCVSREGEWLKEIKLGGDAEEEGSNIYQETKRNTEPYDLVIKENSPWGFGPIVQAVRNSGFSEANHGPGFKLGELCKLLEEDQDFSLSLRDSLYLHHYNSNLKISKVKSLVEKNLALSCLAQDMCKDEVDELLSFFDDQSEVKNVIKNLPDGELSISLDVSKIKQALEESGDKYALLIVLFHEFYRGKKKGDLVECLKHVFNCGEVVVFKSMYSRYKSLLSDLSLDECMEFYSMFSQIGDSYYLRLYEEYMDDQGVSTPLYRKLKAINRMKNNEDDSVHALLDLLRSSGKNKIKAMQEAVYEYINSSAPEIENISMWNEVVHKGDEVSRLSLFALSYKANVDLLENVSSLIKLSEALTDFEKTVLKSVLEVRKGNGYEEAVRVINISSQLENVNSKQAGSFFGSLSFLPEENFNGQFSHDGEKVSIVICAYNSRETLQYSYDSIANQSYQSKEIIVIDDNSDIPVESYLCVNDNVETKILRNEKNVGPYVARNIGIECSSGKIISFHDADDWAHPGKLCHQVEKMKAGAYYAVYDKHIRVNPLGMICPENNLKFIGDGPITGIFSKSLFEHVGKFVEARTRGDVEFRRRILSYLGESSICQTECVSVVALDWNSNSKKEIDSYIKKVKLNDFKKSFQRNHRFKVAL
ncbi:glycosyltransferase family 2 protein [Halomonas elongata]|uniref:glycosyltransferase family 2 protein n=1 Tax=Halomonas elongata TaxID=2746 RepID=UPI0033492220